MYRLLTTIGLLLVIVAASQAFTPSQFSSSRIGSFVYAEVNDMAHDPNEVVARRIVVKGDVQGGYYRSCVLNEVRHGNAIMILHH